MRLASSFQVSSWGHEAVFQKDGIVLSCAMPSSAKAPKLDELETFQTWRRVWASLKSARGGASGVDELAAGCYAPATDMAALAGLHFHV